MTKNSASPPRPDVWLLAVGVAIACLVASMVLAGMGLVLPARLLLVPMCVAVGVALATARWPR